MHLILPHPSIHKLVFLDILLMQALADKRFSQTLSAEFLAPGLVKVKTYWTNSLLLISYKNTDVMVIRGFKYNKSPFNFQIMSNHRMWKWKTKSEFVWLADVTVAGRAWRFISHLLQNCLYLPWMQFEFYSVGPCIKVCIFSFSYNYCAISVGILFCLFSMILVCFHK